MCNRKKIGMTLYQRHAFKMTRLEVWVGQLGKWWHVGSLKGWLLTFISNKRWKWFLVDLKSEIFLKFFFFKYLSFLKFFNFSFLIYCLFSIYIIILFYIIFLFLTTFYIYLINTILKTHFIINFFYLSIYFYLILNVCILKY